VNAGEAMSDEIHPVKLISRLWPKIPKASRGLVRSHAKDFQQLVANFPDICSFIGELSSRLTPRTGEEIILTGGNVKLGHLRALLSAFEERSAKETDAANCIAMIVVVAHINSVHLPRSHAEDFVLGNLVDAVREVETRDRAEHLAGSYLLCLCRKLDSTAPSGKTAAATLIGANWGECHYRVRKALAAAGVDEADIGHDCEDDLNAVEDESFFDVFGTADANKSDEACKAGQDLLAKAADSVPSKDNAPLPGLERLNAGQLCLLEAASESEPQIGDRLAELAGYPNNSNTRSNLSRLVDQGYLKTTKQGYLRAPGIALPQR